MVFKKNVVQCFDERGFGPDLDPDALVVVEIPDSAGCWAQELVILARWCPRNVDVAGVTGHGSGMASLAPRIVSTGYKEASFKPPCHMPNGLGRLPREAESMEDHELPEDSVR